MGIWIWIQNPSIYYQNIRLRPKIGKIFFSCSTKINGNQNMLGGRMITINYSVFI